MWRSVRPKLDQLKRYLSPLQREDNKLLLLSKPPVRATFNIIGRKNERDHVQPILTRATRPSAMFCTVGCYTSLVSNWRTYSTMSNRDNMPGTTASESEKMEERSTVVQERHGVGELEHSSDVAMTRTNQTSESEKMEERSTVVQERHGVGELEHSSDVAMTRTNQTSESEKMEERSTVVQERHKGGELEHSSDVAMTRTNQTIHDSTVPCEESVAVASLTCGGCGALLQPNDPKIPGFIPKPKYQELKRLRLQQNSTEPSTETDSGVEGFEKPPLSVCQRCFSLKHYNTALNITLRADDYLRHLSHLKEKKALILLMVDVVDFPGSLFPDLNTLISPTNPVVIVANKADLLPKHLGPTFFPRFESMIVKEPSLAGCRIAKVYFISAKSGRGVEQLSEDIVSNWGNRGDVYLLGCTNVGKSSLFNRLLATLCGARPGDLTTESNISAPAATISQWPGTTLGLLRFPLMSVGKRRRLIAHARKMKEANSVVAAAREEEEDGEEEEEEEEEDGEHYTSGDHEESVAFNEEAITPRQAKKMTRALPEMEDVLTEIGLRREPRKPTQQDSSPQNRFWLHDTPGAINDAQLINLLTTKELNLALPKKSLRPRTFILRPGECMLLGGLARLDYCKGPTSAYFTVFAASYLPVHTTKVDKADRVHSRNLGNHLLKVPFGDEERLRQFPQLESREILVTGRGWRESSADVVLSSAGWVAVTINRGHVMTLRAHTPGGRGIFQRQPSLISEAVNKRGKRSQKGNRTAFTGRKRRQH